MSDYQAPITNPLPPMPAPVAPIIDQMPSPGDVVPDLPAMPAPSIESIATAHSDMMDGDLSADAIAQARLAQNGSGAGVDVRAQVGSPGNGATIYGGANTQSGIYSGAKFQLTNEELRAELGGDIQSGPDGTKVGANATVEGGDEESAALFEVGVQDHGDGPDVYGRSDVRIGDPNRFNFRLTAKGSNLASTPQGTVGARMGGPLGPVEVESRAHITTDGDKTQGGGGGSIGIPTPAGTIKAYGEGETDGTNSSGGAGVIFQGQF